MDEALVREALRRDIKQLQIPGLKIRVDLSCLVKFDAGIEAGRRNAVLAQELHLILHQGDERRNDHRESSEM